MPCGPSGRSCAPGGADRANCRPQIVGVAVNQGEPQSFAVRQEPLASPSVHTRPNSVFTACLILVLDKIQSLDHARWGSLQRDSYSRTTIRHSSKPGPWCRRTRERYRRNRHNRSPLSHLADLCSGALSDGDVGRDPSHRGAPQAALSRACGPTGGPIAKRMKNQLCRIRRCYIALRRARWLGTSGIVRLPRVRSARGSLPRRE
jgi:hypothetical protein